MKRPVLVFWGAVVAVAGGFAVLSALLLPFESLGLDTTAERQRAWLLTLWTGGVLGLLFGLSSILGALGGVGVREVVEAGSLTGAVKTHRQAQGRWGGMSFHRSFGWWLVAVGGLLIVIYFVSWRVL